MPNKITRRETASPGFTVIARTLTRDIKSNKKKK